MNLQSMFDEKKEVLNQVITAIKSREEQIKILQREIESLEAQAFQLQGALAMVEEISEALGKEQEKQNTKVAAAEVLAE